MHDIYIGQLISDRSLYHHGILGMKWGKRNGPPYPLGASEHSASEKKAGWRKSLASSSKDSKSAGKRAGFSLSNNQKKAIALGAASILSVYGGYKLYQSGALDGFINKGQAAVKTVIRPEAGGGSSGSSKPRESFEERLNKVNPHRDSGDIAYQMNCGNCVLADEARCRGENMEALGNPDGMTVAQLAGYFKGIRSDSISNPKIQIPNVDKEEIKRLAKFRGPNAVKELMVERGKQVQKVFEDNIANSFPPNSRGCALLPTLRGSHWVKFETDNTGKAKLYDPQNPSVNLTETWFSVYHYYKNDMNAQATVIRVDDLEFSPHIDDAIQQSGRGARVMNDRKVLRGSNFTTVRD